MAIFRRGSSELTKKTAGVLRLVGQGFAGHAKACGRRSIALAWFQTTHPVPSLPHFPPCPPPTQVPTRGVSKSAVLRKGPELPGTCFGPDGVEQRPLGGILPAIFFVVADRLLRVPGRLDVGDVVGGAADVAGRVDGRGEGG